jgi:hypothetical protein
MAVLAGRGVGRDAGLSEATAIALATAAGETAVGASRVLRAGLRVGEALGLMVGTGETAARRVAARAICICVPAEGASAGAEVALAVAATRAACRATVAAEGLNCGLDDCVGARVASVAAAVVETLGRTKDRSRRATTGVGSWTIVGAGVAWCRRETTCCEMVVGVWGTGSTVVRD